MPILAIGKNESISQEKQAFWPIEPSRACVLVCVCSWVEGGSSLFSASSKRFGHFPWDSCPREQDRDSCAAFQGFCGLERVQRAVLGVHWVETRKYLRKGLQEGRRWSRCANVGKRRRSAEQMQGVVVLPVRRPKRGEIGITAPSKGGQAP